jgi:membrane protein required for colicin V production
MNWVDGILVALLLATVVVGSKKGLIRELSAFVIFFAALIIAVRYIDRLAVWVHNQVGGSPMISAFLAFIILLAAAYALFKVAGLAFYRVAEIKQNKKRDPMGGALVGFLRGWMAVSFLTLIVFLLPMPEWFYTSFEKSFFGPTIAKTIPLIYDGTSGIHRDSHSFMEKSLDEI